MNILDHQNFIETRHNDKFSEDGGGSSSQRDSSTSEKKEFYSFPHKHQMGVLLTDDFSKFATLLINGEQIITHSDGCVEHKSASGEITTLMSSSALRASGKETILSAGFKAHYIRVLDGVTIKVLETGEIQVSEDGGEDIKIRASNKMNNNYIK
jgi:5-enolpyruvylshikimate-3-phosphate synthase